MFATKSNSNRKVFAFTLVLSMIITMMLSGVLALADTKAQATKDAQAKRNLTGYVRGELSQNEYQVEGGGSLSGEELFEGSPTTGYDLKADEFGKLSSKGQSELVADIAEESNNAITSGKASGVTEATVQNWWKELQSKPGVGTKFLNEILKNTKPDFVTANKIYKPFSGLVGTIMGLIAVLVMAFLGIVMIADIAYITLPPVRMFVADDGGGNSGKPKKSNIFSHDAIYAVKCAEEGNDNTSGGGKQALGIYFKRRVIMLIVLGICLMYLIQGQIYTLVGYILTLVSGFLGF